MTSHTPRRTIRVADDIWDTAGDAAWENGETLSDVIRRALDQYILANQPAPLPPPHTPFYPPLDAG